MHYLPFWTWSYPSWSFHLVASNFNSKASSPLSDGFAYINWQIDSLDVVQTCNLKSNCTSICCINQKETIGHLHVLEPFLFYWFCSLGSASVIFLVHFEHLFRDLEPVFLRCWLWAILSFLLLQLIHPTAHWNSNFEKQKKKSVRIDSYQKNKQKSTNTCTLE